MRVRMGNRSWVVFLAVGLVMASFVCRLWGQAPARTVIPFGNLAAGTNYTTITSETLDFDYLKSVAIFRQNVVVESGSMRMQSDRLTVTFQGTNQLDRIEADGNVRFRHPQGTGSCQRAIYTAKDGSIVLAGKAVLNMRQPGSINVIQGDIITFLVVNDELHSIKAKKVKMEHKSLPDNAVRRSERPGRSGD